MSIDAEIHDSLATIKIVQKYLNPCSLNRCDVHKSDPSVEFHDDD
jgi:hypothetical protein